MAHLFFCTNTDLTDTFPFSLVGTESFSSPFFQAIFDPSLSQLRQTKYF